MRNNILLAVALATFRGDAAALSPQLVERAACNRDNLFRCFIDQRYSMQASQFCANLSPSTVTVATVTATETTTVETELTADAATSTEIFTTTVFTETIATATTTVTFDPDALLAKRDASVNPPKCMTNGVTYPASRITSACSCIDVPASTVSVTYVAGTETVTETSTVFTTPSPATVTTWTTVSTAAAGVETVTVAPTGTTNRLSFQNGTMNGWELLPSTWPGEMRKVTVNGATEWSFNFHPIDNSLATLRYLPLVYMEAGRYQAGFTSYLLAFPAPIGPWGRFFVFDIVNPSKGTNITVTLPQNAGKKILNGRIVTNVQSAFDIPESAAGYSQITVRWIATPLWALSALNNLAVEKIG
ncbi:hypothetical protein CDV36_000299 [Fusarium kuroshium]|uniref:Uncharacterized protein n=1 Tax=Fusarium kuroshium TaxID=2010991 RepID=A0A3M2SRA0_9HYPO|nr:hypothetical protein CDV36_000299 [Fusarium kuroshium]